MINMIEIFGFLSVFFALLGIFIAKYIYIYREVYNLWIQEIVYDDFNGSYTSRYDSNYGRAYSHGVDSNLCSRVESYAREIYAYTNIIRFLVFVIFIISLIAIYFAETNKTSNTQYLTVLIFIFLTISSVFTLLHYARINPISPNEKIDRKLFDVWCKINIYRHESGLYLNDLQSARMYEILAEKINEYGIEEAYEILEKKTDENEIKEVNNKVFTAVLDETIKRVKSEANKKCNLHKSMLKDKNFIKRLEKSKKQNK